MASICSFVYPSWVAMGSLFPPFSQVLTTPSNKACNTKIHTIIMCKTKKIWIISTNINSNVTSYCVDTLGEGGLIFFPCPGNKKGSKKIQLHFCIIYTGFASIQPIYYIFSTSNQQLCTEFWAIYLIAITFHCQKGYKKTTVLNQHTIVWMSAALLSRLFKGGNNTTVSPAAVHFYEI